MKYRSRTDISAHILEIAAATTNGGSGATKTRIMYGAFLSYFQLKDYLSILMEKGLLEFIPESKKYRTTHKGLRFLQAINQLAHLSGSERKKNTTTTKRKNDSAKS
jgi:predicted transcriptional regulator